jgi:hypothetical protein
VLSNTNYPIWALRMKVILEANGLLEVIVRNTYVEVDAKKDKASLAYLYQGLSEAYIARCKL